jgi:HEAT repeat protein
MVYLDASFVVGQWRILNSPTATESEKLATVIKLQAPDQPAGTLLLHEALRNDSPKVRLAAAVLLFKRGDASVLPILEEPLMKSYVITITDESMDIQPGERVNSIAEDPLPMLQKITDPNAAPVLVRLESSADARVQYCAHFALWKMGKETEPPRF